MDLGHIDYQNINSKCYLLKLKKISRAITKKFDFYLRNANIRATQFNLLVGLTGDYASLGELSNAMGMDRSTVSVNLRPLKKEGYIVKGKAVNRRSLNYVLTGKGEAVVIKAFPLWETVNRYTKKLLSKVGDNMGADLDEIDLLLKDWVLK